MGLVTVMHSLEHTGIRPSKISGANLNASVLVQLFAHVEVVTFGVVPQPVQNIVTSLNSGLGEGLVIHDGFFSDSEDFLEVLESSEK